MITTCEEHGTDAVVVFKNFISCPMCKEVERGDELEREVGGLDSQINRLESEVSNLEFEVSERDDEIAVLGRKIAELESEVSKT